MRSLANRGLLVTGAPDLEFELILDQSGDVNAINAAAQVGDLVLEQHGTWGGTGGPFLQSSTGGLSAITQEYGPYLGSTTGWRTFAHMGAGILTQAPSNYSWVTGRISRTVLRPNQAITYSVAGVVNKNTGYGSPNSSYPLPTNTISSSGGTGDAVITMESIGGYPLSHTGSGRSCSPSNNITSAHLIQYAADGPYVNQTRSGQSVAGGNSAHEQSSYVTIQCYLNIFVA